VLGLVLGGQRPVTGVGGEQRGDGLAQRAGRERVGQLDGVEPGRARGPHVGVVVRLAGDQPGHEHQRRHPLRDQRGQGQPGQRSAGPRQHAAPVDPQGVEQRGGVGRRHLGPVVGGPRGQRVAAAVAGPVERQQPHPRAGGQPVVGMAGQARVRRAVQVEHGYPARIADVVHGQCPVLADRDGPGGHDAGTYTDRPRRYRLPA
jgi:hypothetical protein